MVRTDLAEEAAADCLRGSGGSVEGIRQRARTRFGCPVTEIRIETGQAAEQLGKPQGCYLTVNLNPLLRRETDGVRLCAQAVGACLRRLLPPVENQTVLVAGLGNRTITPDAVGPWAAEQILVTRHLGDQPECAGLRPVAAVAAGVLGTTGVESMELLRGIVDRVQPGLVIAVDALAARSMERLCATVQLADTGIVPGSGVGNARKGLNRESLGVPVLAVGVPTVVDGATLAEDLCGHPVEETHAAASVIVTPRDIDRQALESAKIVAMGINMALQQLDWSTVESLLA